MWPSRACAFRGLSAAALRTEGRYEMGERGFRWDGQPVNRERDERTRHGSPAFLLNRAKT